VAKPRIFVSSTYYDLKHIRASLELFITSLGFEPILSEKGDITFTPDRPLDESCYREAKNSDIYVLIIGGRYGSEVSRGKKRGETKSFYERYDSITKEEYKAAATENIPIYILIEKSVYSEYQTYLKNKDRNDIVYAHADSVNIFKLIEEILAQKQNNPVQTFERHSDIESWLREQWSGLFREMLRTRLTQSQIGSLATQVAELSEVNHTLRIYLEKLLSKTDPKGDSKRLITNESRRLSTALMKRKISKNRLGEYLTQRFPIGEDRILDILHATPSFARFLTKLSDAPMDTSQKVGLLNLQKFPEAERDYEELREIAGLPALRKRRKANRVESQEEVEAKPEISNTEVTVSEKAHADGSP